MKLKGWDPRTGVCTECGAGPDIRIHRAECPMLPQVDRICKDCVAGGTPRPAPYPGPRCLTHHREVTRARKKRAQEKAIERGFGITPAQYDALYEAQGGRCYVCTKSTGKTRRLAVDHDHRCCPGPVSCGRCIRGLACGRCNHDVLPLVGDRPEDWERVAEALRHPVGLTLFPVGT